jgi:hypothetical protein
VVNLVLCLGFAFWPLPAIVISTTSILVAARNFQSAWLMRSLGEHRYREWHLERLQETSITLYLFCLFGQTVPTAGVGLALMYFSDWQRNPVPQAIGIGIVAYALAVTVYTLLGTWRLRRAAWRVQQQAASASRNGDPVAPPAGKDKLVPLCLSDPAQPFEP